MRIVLLAALGVGGATMLGTLGGFLFRRMISCHKNAVDAFSAGLMLVAAILGLLEPALSCGGIWIAIFGIFTGALSLVICDAGILFLREKKGGVTNEEGDRVLLLFLAIAVHNFPEGMAAGVGFGQLATDTALLIAGEIAVQNLPEGMVIVGPMLASGVTGKRTFFLALVTAIIEVVGAVFGYFAVELASAILPFVLSFACGMMLYVIFDEMIPDATRNGKRASVSLSFLVGVCLMLIFDVVL